MTMLAETVDVVIGVDTHKHTHTAAFVGAVTGALLQERTVPTDPSGYTTLLELACAHGARRAWATERTGSFGSGLTRHLTEKGERVIELDRPWRDKRRGRGKSDSIDALWTPTIGEAPDAAVSAVSGPNLEPSIGRPFRLGFGAVSSLSEYSVANTQPSTS